MKRAGKKALVMSAAAVVSAVVLVATAFAAAANVSGYEALKQSGFAILEQCGNSTSDISVELFSDGEKVAFQKEIMQINEDQDARYTRSESFAVGEGAYWSEHYWNSDHTYYINSNNPDQYNMIINSYGPRNHGEDQVLLTENQKKLAGILMDLFTGDIKNYFMMDGNTVSVSLNKNQIPELIQSFLAVGAERIVSERDTDYNRDSDMENVLAQYLYNPVIQSGTMTAVLSDNGCPAEIDARIDFSGMDENGASHNASIIINMAFSDIGNTKVKTFNPEGKTQIEYDYEKFEIDNGDYDISITIPEQDQFEADEFAIEIETPEL